MESSIILCPFTGQQRWKSWKFRYGSDQINCASNHLCGMCLYLSSSQIVVRYETNTHT